MLKFDAGVAYFVKFLKCQRQPWKVLNVDSLLMTMLRLNHQLREFALEKSKRELTSSIRTKEIQNRLIFSGIIFRELINNRKNLFENEKNI